MRLVGVLAVGLSSLGLQASGPVMAAPAASEAYHIVLPRRTLGAGESVELRLVPPPPAGARVHYGTVIGTIGIGFPNGIYRAPYVIPPGTLPVRVSAGFSMAGFRASATTEIELLPGSVPAAEDCLGPGQSFSTVMAEIEPSHVQLDGFPHLVQRVEPEYPRSSFVRGIEDTIPVRALLCRNGRVLDAYALTSYRDTPTGLQPFERDPKLVDAAVAAVRQYVFSPGTVGGQAVALWINTVVAFHR